MLLNWMRSRTSRRFLQLNTGPTIRGKIYDILPKESTATTLGCPLCMRSDKCIQKMKSGNFIEFCFCEDEGHRVFHQGARPRSVCLWNRQQSIERLHEKVVVKNGSSTTTTQEAKNDIVRSSKRPYTSINQLHDVPPRTTIQQERS